MSKIVKYGQILTIMSLLLISMAGSASADSVAVVSTIAEANGGTAIVHGTAIASDVQTYANIDARAYGNARSGGFAIARHDDWDEWGYPCACDPTMGSED